METDSRDVLTRPPPRRPLSERIRDWVTWFGLGRLVVTAVSVVAIAAGGYWLVRVPQPPVEAGLPRATAAGPPSTSSPLPSGTAVTTATAGTIVVHVAGAVAAPGLYRLPAASRADDAIAAAGGPAAGAALDAINLAAPLGDGTRLYVPVAGETPPLPASGGTQPAAGLLNVNTADAEQLDALPGIGPATAAAIVVYRQVNGPFAGVDDLAKVRGIGPAKLDVLRPLVTV